MQDYSRATTFAESTRGGQDLSERGTTGWWNVQRQLELPVGQGRNAACPPPRYAEGDLFDTMAANKKLSQGGSSDQMKAWKASQGKPSSEAGKSMKDMANDVFGQGKKAWDNAKSGGKNLMDDIFLGMQHGGEKIGALGIEPNKAQKLGSALRDTSKYAKANAVNIAKIIATVGLAGAAAVALKNWHDRNSDADEGAVVAQAKEFKKMKRESDGNHDLWGRGQSLRDHIEHDFYPQPDRARLF